VNVRVIPRTTVDGYLKLVRLPLDVAIGLLPGNGTGRGTAAGLALDRVDAAARTVAGAVLGDPVLREDAARRRLAAGERQRAFRLRTEAQRKSERAESRLAERRDQADRQRKRATQRAQKTRRQAERRREQKIRQAAEAASKRRGTSRKAAARSDAKVDARARRARLRTLDTKADALREKEEALTASDEARRLRGTASRAKAARKNG
jgi:hypothetical protein